VLANGSISEINLSSNPELYWALRGGGNNFGIVTRFDIETHPQPPMWGGFNVMLFPDIPAQLEALGIPRILSFAPKALLVQFGSLANKLVCKLGYCINFSQYSELIERFSKDAESDPAAQSFVAMVLVPYVNLYIATFHVTHGANLQNSPSIGVYKSLKSLWSTNRIAKASDFARELQNFNAKADR
jgi:hypothetical protein